MAINTVWERDELGSGETRVDRGRDKGVNGDDGSDESQGGSLSQEGVRELWRTLETIPKEREGDEEYKES